MQVGQHLVYALIVENAGPAAALAVTVTDPLPAVTTFVLCQTSQGTCAGPPVGSTGTVTFDLGTIGAGATATLQIEVVVTGAASGSILNTATVSTSTPDSNPDNNTDDDIVVGGATIPMLEPRILALLATALAAAALFLIRRQ